MADAALQDRGEPEVPPKQPSPPQSAGQLADPAQAEEAANLDKVLQSDVGLTTLLTRLKQSIASAKDFATFLRKRSILEEEHAHGLKKLARAVHDSATRPDTRSGTFSRSYDEMNKIHDRMADHGLQFAVSLHQMSEDINELSSNTERGRKHWKQNGLAAEKRVQDAESMAEKAKAKYDSLAEQYDRARTGEKAPGKFGLKGPKSAAQQEEDLLRKVQQADSDYASKVQAAQTQRQELIATLRPQAVCALQDLIKECDSAVSLQMQKFATFNEKLLLGSGLTVSPMKSGPNGVGMASQSLRDAARQIDDEKDLKDYVLSHLSKVTLEPTTIKYERHPTLATPQAGAHSKRQSLSLQTPPPPPQTAAQTFSQLTASSPSPATHAPPIIQQNRRSSLSGGAQQFPYNPPGSPKPALFQELSAQRRSDSRERLPSLPGPPPGPPHQPELPPLKPVFGLSLDDLYRRDGTAIPMVVYQCIQAVELFGLNVEGIYRLSGNATHVSRMKALFDNDSSKVDFTNPENFYHDVNSVAGLLKQFFRDLPDPLFTNERYNDFIAAARKDDDIQRRDAIHALINSLPDPNYATLRALVLHLNHVQERSSENRMNAGNIAISFGLTLMGSNAGHNIADSGWQARIIETVLQNTFQIFDDD